MLSNRMYASSESWTMRPNDFIVCIVSGSRLVVRWRFVLARLNSLYLAERNWQLEVPLIV
jgi:hypothetical protein